MDSGLSIKPVVGFNYTAPVRIEPPAPQQPVATDLSPEKAVSAPTLTASADYQSRQPLAITQSPKAREVVFDDETNQVIFRVVNVRSGQVVRQVPEESFLHLRAHIRALTESEDGALPHAADLEA